MKITEILVETRLTEKVRAATAAKQGAGAFGSMATQLSGNKPNTMANAPVSASNKAKPNNPNLVSPVAARPPAATVAAPTSQSNTPARPSATVQGTKSGFNKAFGAKAFDVGVDKFRPTPNSGDYGQLSNDESKIWNNKIQKWEPYDQTAKAAQPNAQQSVDPIAAAPQTAAGAQTSNTVPGASTQSQTRKVQPSQTSYAQVKASVDKLDTRGKRQIYKLLQNPSTTKTPAVRVSKAAVKTPATTPAAGKVAIPPKQRRRQ